MPRAFPTLAAAASLALTATAPALAADAQARMTYDVYVGGLRMLEVESGLALGADRYDVDLSAHVVGIAAAFSDWRSNVRSSGAVDGPRVQPARNVVQRINGDSDKTTTITFLGGGKMDVEIVPSTKPKREQAIPPQQLVHALDPMSGVVSILQAMHVGAAACTGQVPVFDGRRLYRADLADGGTVMLDKAEQGMYGGQAQRCTISLTPMVGDFNFGDERRNAKPTEYLQRTSRAPDQRVITTWLASPGGNLPAVPVRIESESPWGRVIVHLRAVAAGAS
ncbi:MULTISPECIES: DUF3108 domain-containing protein [Inquilinus]|uniref:DUF3108 domain-containing protein n=1 Tax=Inquilinus ginsengisoli TaxID=363840 RepID=A0ABU1K176_9PROT|nr:DUF3108 domain-containing protein [Inquilinus ginsengisoli]MDR6294620.1 hypothetical protein [Inquilinus ginsengisoli]